MEPVEAHVVHEDDVEVESWPGIVSWRTLLSGDRTPTEALTLGTAEIEPGATTAGALHRHAPPEAYYVLAGEGIVHVDDEELPVRAGSAVFVPGDAWHVVRNTGDSVLRLLFAFAVDAYREVTYVHADPGSTAGPPLA